MASEFEYRAIYLDHNGEVDVYTHYSTLREAREHARLGTELGAPATVIERTTYDVGSSTEVVQVLGDRAVLALGGWEVKPKPPRQKSGRVVRPRVVCAYQPPAVVPPDAVWVYDDGGRHAAGFDGLTGDCVVRSIAIAAQLPYLEVYRALADGMGRYLSRNGRMGTRSARNGVAKSVYHRYLTRTLGWRWVPTMGIGTGCRVHLRRAELPSGRLAVCISGHMTAMIDGVIHDTYDCSRGGTRCVYGYYREVR